MLGFGRAATDANADQAEAVRSHFVRQQVATSSEDARGELRGARKAPQAQ